MVASVRTDTLPQNVVEQVQGLKGTNRPIIVVLNQKGEEKAAWSSYLGKATVLSAVLLAAYAYKYGITQAASDLASGSAEVARGVGGAISALPHVGERFDRAVDVADKGMTATIIGLGVYSVKTAAGYLAWAARKVSPLGR